MSSLYFYNYKKATFLYLFRQENVAFNMVEARGVEPLSETISSSASTGVSCIFTFPTVLAHRQAFTFSIL